MQDRFDAHISPVLLLLSLFVNKWHNGTTTTRLMIFKAGSAIPLEQQLAVGDRRGIAA